MSYRIEIRGSNEWSTVTRSPAAIGVRRLPTPPKPSNRWAGLGLVISATLAALSAVIGLMIDSLRGATWMSVLAALYFLGPLLYARTKNDNGLAAAVLRARHISWPVLIAAGTLSAIKAVTKIIVIAPVVIIFSGLIIPLGSLVYALSNFEPTMNQGQNTTVYFLVCWGIVGGSIVVLVTHPLSEGLCNGLERRHPLRPIGKALLVTSRAVRWASRLSARILWKIIHVFRDWSLFRMLAIAVIAYVGLVSVLFFVFYVVVWSLVVPAALHTEGAFAWFDERGVDGARVGLATVAALYFGSEWLAWLKEQFESVRGAASVFLSEVALAVAAFISTGFAVDRRWETSWLDVSLVAGLTYGIGLAALLDVCQAGAAGLWGAVGGRRSAKKVDRTLLPDEWFVGIAEVGERLGLRFV